MTEAACSLDVAGSRSPKRVLFRMDQSQQNNLEVKLLRARSGKVIFLESGPDFVEPRTVSLGLWLYGFMLHS